MQQATMLLAVRTTLELFEDNFISLAVYTTNNISPKLNHTESDQAGIMLCSKQNYAE